MTIDPSPPADRTATLNRDCFCITLDRGQLLDAVSAASGGSELVAELITARPNLFSNGPVFLAHHDLTSMMGVVEAIEAVAEDPGYQGAALQWAPEIARHDFGPRGVFMGYDFHLGPDGPKLIEVNTNAGGAFVNAVLARAQQACCREAEDALQSGPLDFEVKVWEAFLAEWRSQGRAGNPRTIAIVDDQPTEQYMFPEFLLAQRFFEQHGVTTSIIDPGQLVYSEGRLLLDGEAIDMVYNRLVDFSLSEGRHAALREGYLAGAVVVTPNPRNHALLADKRNLILLSDPHSLAAWGTKPAQRQFLVAVPRTSLVTPENADQLWTERKGYFFKPAGGHGGKAVYRGDKLTRGVWDEIIQGDYIAQESATPSERRILIDGEVQSMKLDVRLYTYRASPMLVAARVYQGQTTNFRTPGGGFAPVFVV